MPQTRAVSFPIPQDNSLSQARKILIYRLGSLGDTLIALPAFHKVRQSWPQAQISLLTNKPISPKAVTPEAVLQNTGLVDRYLFYPSESRSFAVLTQLMHDLRNEQFDCVVRINAWRGRLRDLRDRIFFRLSGVNRQVGPSWNFSRHPKSIGNGLYESEAARVAACISALGPIDLDSNDSWDLRLNNDESATARQHLNAHGIPEGFIALSMGTKLDVNDWTEPNWISLIQQLNARYSRLGLVLLGAQDERERADRCASLWSGPKANLCGQVMPRITAALTQHAALFIGHDSGPLHLAAAVGTPCVAIFSARNRPGQWFPRGTQHTIFYHRLPCAGCQLEICREHQKKCILSIDVPEVFQAAEKYLNRDALAKTPLSAS